MKIPPQRKVYTNIKRSLFGGTGSAYASGLLPELCEVFSETLHDEEIEVILSTATDVLYNVGAHCERRGMGVARWVLELNINLGRFLS